VIIRRFEPSVTFTTTVPHESAKHPPEYAVSVSIRRCIARGEDNESINPDFKVYQRFYDEYNEEFKFVELSRGGSIYFKELFVEVPECYFSEELGYVEPPKVFEDRGTRGYRRNFIYHTTDENNKPKEIWLYYLKDFEKLQSEDEFQPSSSESLETEHREPTESVLSFQDEDEQLTLF